MKREKLEGGDNDETRPDRICCTWLATPPDPAVCPPEGCRLVWLYVNEGHVKEVVELFFP